MTWEQMSARERDRWVAERVFGQTVYVSQFHGELCVNNGKRPPGLVPKYSTDVAADYLVLEHVRNTWGHADKLAFDVALQRLCEREAIEATRVDPGPMLRCAMFYQKGFYSHAAYLVLEGETNGE